MSKGTKIFLIGEKNNLYTTIQEPLSQIFDFTFLHVQTFRAEMKRHEPNIVLILKNEHESPIDTIQFLLKEIPDLSIIILHDQQDFQLLREVTRAGALDFLIIPDEMNLFIDRLQTLEAHSLSKPDAITSVASFKRGRGQVFAFYSGKGGSGKTFLSTTFAQTLKLESTAKVLFIDLNLQYGGAEAFLGIESSRNLIDLKPVINEINEHHIRNVSEKEPFSKLEILISPMDAELAEAVDEEYIIRLIRACRRSYDFIIVDVPSVMDERSYAVLTEADKIYYVMNLNTPSIKVLKHVEGLFQRLGIVTDDRLEIVINETGKENELAKKDMERFVRYPVCAEIRRDFKGVLAAVNQGRPIRKEPKEKKLVPAAKDIQKWVTSMLK
ncbi:MAG TPA: AAA family ATPase [Pseudoneobacillus sp.]|nr:AAA family ATPase [Pseudoneobacillus sp.]